MKKRLSLLLATLVTSTLIPISTFAVTTVESTAFTAEYGKTGVSAQKTYVMEVDTQLDSIKTTDPIRLDLSNAKFLNVTVDKTVGTGTFGTVTRTDTIATIPVSTEIGSGAKFKINLTVDTAGSSVGDVLLAVRNNLLEKPAYKIGTVKEAEAKTFSVSVTDDKLTVSKSGGKLSEFELKDYNKTKPIEIKIREGKAVLSKDTKINGVDLDPVPSNATFADGKLTLSPAFLGSVPYVVVDPVVLPDRSMKLGNLELEATNDGNTIYAKLGEATDYNIAIAVNENGKANIPTVEAGRRTTVKVSLTGPLGSITQGRVYKFKLNGATVAYNNAGVIQGITGTNLSVGRIKDTDSGQTSEFILSTTAVNPTKIEFSMEIMTKATTKDGTVTMTVTSDDLAKDITTDIAKINQTYNLTIKPTEIKRGEAAKTSDIVITEAKAGKTNQGEYIEIKLKGDQVAFSKLPTFEATNGLKFGKVEWMNANAKDSVRAMVSTRSSGAPAQITISGVEVDMFITSIQDRMYPLSIRIGDTDFGDFDYAKAVSQYGLASGKIVFTLGSANYTVGGVAKTLEAPVFTKAGRTMLPIGPLALALGLEVNYNEETKTASFKNSGTGQVVTLVEGASELTNNGVKLPMYTSSTSVKGRIFVPVASITDAFGSKIAWDAVTQTITIN